MVDPDRLKVFIDDSKQEFWPVDEDGKPIPLEPGGEFEIGEDGPSGSSKFTRISDLSAIHLGFGVFTANDPRVWMASAD